MTRLPPPELDKLSAEQRRVYDRIVSGPRGGVGGLFATLLHVPDLADRIQHLGKYLRFDTSFPTRLTEFVILITARHYSCQYEWYAHEPKAQEGGLAQSTIDAIRERKRPSTMQSDETTVFDFTTELLRGGKVSDEAYERVVKTFGTQGAVELGAIVGYYIMLAMTLLAHEVPLPPGEVSPFALSRP